MAVTNQEIQQYLAANPGLSDRQIAAKMDEYKVTPAQMAAATGLSADSVNSRYDTATKQNTIGSYLMTPGIKDTEIAKQMDANQWSSADVAGATGLSQREVDARYQTASGLNTLADQNATLQGNYSSLQGNYTTLQQQMAELNAQFNELKKQRSGSTNTGGIVGGTTADMSSSNFMTNNANNANSGVVWGPDGRMYSSAAAAIAAGVPNFSTTKPVLTSNAANPNTAGGGLIENSMSTSPGSTKNPFAAGGPFSTQTARVGLPPGVLGI